MELSWWRVHIKKNGLINRGCNREKGVTKSLITYTRYPVSKTALDVVQWYVLTQESKRPTVSPRLHSAHPQAIQSIRSPVTRSLSIYIITNWCNDRPRWISFTFPKRLAWGVAGRGRLLIGTAVWAAPDSWGVTWTRPVSVCSCGFLLSLIHIWRCRRGP